MAQTKIRQGAKHITFSCRAPEYLSKYNERLNKEVHDICFQVPKFKPRKSCEKCKYLEVKDGSESIL